MGMVIDHNDPAAVRHQSTYSPLSRASVDRPARVSNREHSLDLAPGELPFVGPGAGMDRPHETPKPGGLVGTGQLA